MGSFYSEPANPQGSYLSYPLTPQCEEAFVEFCTGIEQEFSKGHITLFTSPTREFEYVHVDWIKPLEKTTMVAKKFKLLGRNSEVVVLELENEEIVANHQKLKSAGYTHKFDDFIVHMTLCRCGDEAEAQDLIKKIKMEQLPKVEVAKVPKLEKYVENWTPKA